MTKQNLQHALDKLEGELLRLSERKLPVETLAAIQSVREEIYKFPQGWLDISRGDKQAEM